MWKVSQAKTATATAAAAAAAQAAAVAQQAALMAAQTTMPDPSVDSGGATSGATQDS